MEPTPRLIEELYREEVLEARTRQPDQKLLDGPRLFHRVCSIMEAGIRDQYPDADDCEVRRILDERLDLARRLEGGR
jgi:hypothetical protein